ncbi:MAG: hypothetical protein IPJ41_17245 [Phycisphaerales bacterium]|nr:hypothetical protein [Phycisphaerales bacterium]
MPMPQQEKLRRVQVAQRLEVGANHAGAIQIYRELIKDDPKDAGPHYLLACAQLATLDIPACLRAIREAIRLRDTVPEFFAVQAIALRAAHRLDDALAAADRGLAIDPTNLSAVETKGDLLYVRGRLEEGIGLMMPAYQAGATNPQYLATLARLLSSAKRLPEAREVLERAVSSGGTGQQMAWPHMQLGELLEKSADYEGRGDTTRGRMSSAARCFIPSCTTRPSRTRWRVGRQSVSRRCRGRATGRPGNWCSSWGCLARGRRWSSRSSRRTLGRTAGGS